MLTPKLYEEAQRQLKFFQTQIENYSSIIKQKDEQFLEIQTSRDELSLKNEEVPAPYDAHTGFP